LLWLISLRISLITIFRWAILKGNTCFRRWMYWSCCFCFWRASWFLLRNCLLLLFLLLIVGWSILWRKRSLLRLLLLIATFFIILITILLRARIIRIHSIAAIAVTIILPLLIIQIIFIFFQCNFKCFYSVSDISS